MSEIPKDPFSSSIIPPAEVVSSREILVSLPVSDRQTNHESWRKIVEEADSDEELIASIGVLEDYQRTGLLVPPYTAAVEEWSDGGASSYVLYVGHVEGEVFPNVNVWKPQIQQDYTELGAGILQYLDNCWSMDKPYLTDITRIDQFIYGRTASMDTSKPVLVDLELHSGQGVDGREIQRFIEDFLMPLEEVSGLPQDALRDKVTALTDKYTSLSI